MLETSSKPFEAMCMEDTCADKYGRKGHQLEYIKNGGGGHRLAIAAFSSCAVVITVRVLHHKAVTFRAQKK